MKPTSEEEALRRETRRFMMFLILQAADTTQIMTHQQKIKWLFTFFCCQMLLLSTLYHLHHFFKKLIVPAKKSIYKGFSGLGAYFTKNLNSMVVMLHIQLYSCLIKKSHIIIPKIGVYISLQRYQQLSTMILSY